MWLLIIGIFAFDAFVIGMLTFLIGGEILGDGPLARLIKLLLAIIVGVGYDILIYLLLDYFVISLILILLPFVLIVACWLITYMFKL